MSDELKPCAHCGGRAELYGSWQDSWIVECTKCHASTDDYKENFDAIFAWNTRADDAPEQPVDNQNWVCKRSKEIAERYMLLPVDADGVPIHVGDLLECDANGYEGAFTVFAIGNDAVAGNHDIEWIKDNPDKWFHVTSFCRHINPSPIEDAPEYHVDNAQADSREKLEEDALDYVVRTAKLCHGMGLRHELWQFNPEPLHMHIRQCLDRQAAITRAEVFENGEYDCMTCAAKAELRELVNSLTAERDAARDYAAYKVAECERQQRVIDTQRDSFLKMEREYRELQDVCGELERTIENMRGD